MYLPQVCCRVLEVQSEELFTCTSPKLFRKEGGELWRVVDLPCHQKPCQSVTAWRGPHVCFDVGSCSRPPCALCSPLAEAGCRVMIRYIPIKFTNAITHGCISSPLSPSPTDNERIICCCCLRHNAIIIHNRNFT